MRRFSTGAFINVCALRPANASVCLKGAKVGEGERSPSEWLIACDAVSRAAQGSHSMTLGSGSLGPLPLKHKVVKEFSNSGIKKISGQQSLSESLMNVNNRRKVIKSVVELL